MDALYSKAKFKIEIRNFEYSKIKIRKRPPPCLVQIIRPQTAVSAAAHCWCIRGIDARGHIIIIVGRDYSACVVVGRMKWNCRRRKCCRFQIQLFMVLVGTVIVCILQYYEFWMDYQHIGSIHQLLFIQISELSFIGPIPLITIFFLIKGYPLI